MMTEELTEPKLAAPKAPIGRPRKYPWDEWVAQGEVTITRDIDFSVDVEVMRNLAMRFARRQRINVHLQAKGDSLTMTFTPEDS